MEEKGMLREHLQKKVDTNVNEQLLDKCEKMTHSLNYLILIQLIQLALIFILSIRYL